MFGIVPFLVLLGLFVTGVAMFVVGRRGRRLNDHPICRDCRFDLVGSYPASITCPECGSGLRRPKAVLSGARRRIYSLMVVGAIAAALPLAPAALAIYAAMTGANIHKHLPLGLLLLQARFGSAQTAKAVGEEIHDRMVTLKLDKDQIRSVVAAALEHQADPAFAWTEAWGDIIERANTSGDATAADMTRFRQQALGLALGVKAKVRVGDVLPIRVTKENIRLGSNTQLTVFISGENLRIGGKARPMFFDYHAPRNRQYLGQLTISGSKSNWGRRTWGDQCSVSLQRLGGVEPGEQDFEIDLIMRCDDAMKPRGWSPDAYDPDDRVIPARARLEVLPSTAEVVKLVPADEATTAKFLKALKPTQAWLNIQDEPVFDDQGRQKESRKVTYAMLSFDLSTIPVGISHDVYVRHAGVDTCVCAFTGAVGQGRNPQDGSTWGHAIPGVDGHVTVTVDIVYKPNIQHALADFDGKITSMYNAEIVIPDVKLKPRGPFGNPIDDPADPDEPANPAGASGGEKPKDDGKP